MPLTIPPSTAMEDTGDVAGALRRQEYHQVGEFLGLSDAAQGRLAAPSASSISGGGYALVLGELFG